MDSLLDNKTYRQLTPESWITPYHNYIHKLLNHNKIQIQNSFNFKSGIYKKKSETINFELISVVLLASASLFRPLFSFLNAYPHHSYVEVLFTFWTTSCTFYSSSRFHQMLSICNLSASMFNLFLNFCRI